MAAKKIRPQLKTSSVKIAEQIAATQKAAGSFVEEAKDGAKAPRNEEVKKTVHVENKATETQDKPVTDTRTIEQVVFPKAVNKNNWTKVSPKIRPDVAKAIAYLMQIDESNCSTIQDVFEKHTFEPILEAAKSYGFNSDR